MAVGGSGNGNKMPFFSVLPYSPSLSPGISFLLWALLWTDDTYCSQMRWRRVLSVGDEEEVLLGVEDRKRLAHEEEE